MVKSGTGTKFPPPNKCQQVRGAIINDATQLWIRTPVHLRSPLHFLQLSSHCINDTIYYASLEDLKSTKNDDIQLNKIASIHQKPEFDTSTITYSTNISIDKTSNNGNQCLYMNGQRYEVIATSMPTTIKTPNSLKLNDDINLQNSAKFQNIILSSNGSLNGPTIRLSSDPPPLAFFPKAKMVKREKGYGSEPPPLVPIRHT